MRWGYFNSASCFCFPYVMLVAEAGGSGSSGQFKEPKSWDFPATSCGSNGRCGLGTKKEYHSENNLCVCTHSILRNCMV